MTDANKSTPAPDTRSSPVRTTTSPDTAPKQKAEPLVKPPSWPKLVSWSALILASVSTVIGLFAWAQLKYQLGLAEQARLTMSARIDELDPTPAIERFTKVLNSETMNLRKRIDSQQQQQTSLRTAVVRAHGLASRTQRGWVIAEAHYLVELAQHKLRLMRDLDGAIVALEAAEQRLRTLSDPSFKPIYRALTADIEALKTFPRPNLAAISLKLDQIINQHWLKLIDKPDLQQSQSSSTLTPASKTNKDQPPGQEGLLIKLLKEINKHLIIRRHDQPLQPLPDERIQLYHHQLLRLMLEAIRLAILTENDAEYHRQLQSTIDWINTHYSTINAKPLIGELESLTTIQIRPKLPNVSRSLAALLKVSENERLNDEDA